MTFLFNNALTKSSKFKAKMMAPHLEQLSYHRMSSHWRIVDQNYAYICLVSHLSFPFWWGR